jgi:hypothetical protein
MALAVGFVIAEAIFYQLKPVLQRWLATSNKKG